MTPLRALVAVVAMLSVVLPATAVQAQDGADASIGGLVWDDFDGDGLRTAAEPGVAWVVVYARDVAGVVAGSAVTDADGFYSIAGLAAGEYQAQFMVPLGRSLTAQDAGGDDTIDSDADAVTGYTPSYVLAAGDEITSVDAGVAPQQVVGSIGDFVFVDLNENGVQDAGDGGVQGVVVEVVNDFGLTLGVDTTDASGQYVVSDLPPGPYSVRFNLPGDLEFVPRDVGADDAIDSDVDPATGQTGVFQLGIGADLTTIDAGVLPMATNVAGSVGDFVFLDSDGDGLQDPGEPGVEGVWVEAIDAGGNVVGATVADTTGFYRIDLLPAGSYSLRFELPGGLQFTQANVGADDAIDSDANPSTGETALFELGDGQNLTAIDAGVLPIDNNSRGSFGDLVFEDINQNGLQDAGEPGVAGVIVDVFNASNLKVATDVTDANGTYLVDNLPAGDYVLQFNPPGSILLFTSPDVGADDSIDSDANPVTGLTAPYALAPGENVSTVDAGLIIFEPPRAAIGDFVFLDGNGNGVQDVGEGGVPGVIVGVFDGFGIQVGAAVTDNVGAYLVSDLLPGDYFVVFDLPGDLEFVPRDVGADDAIDSDADPATGQTEFFQLGIGEQLTTIDAGVMPITANLPGSVGDVVFFDGNRNGLQDAGELLVPGVEVQAFDAGGNLVGATVTDADGVYVIGNLPAGFYSLLFIAPSALQFTRQDVGIDDSIDSDVNALTGETALFELGNGENLTTIDAGVLLRAGNSASVGNLVFYDFDADGLQDPDEPGAPGVLVDVVDSAGFIVGSTVTDADGLYVVGGLLAGTYSARFVLPAPYGFTQANVGDDDSLDSDADPATGETAPFTIQSGQNLTTIDAGLVGSFGGFRSELGDFVFFDENANGLQDLGEQGVQGVEVQLFDEAGTIVGSDLTDADGRYLLDNQPPGTYDLLFVPPVGLSFTTPNVGLDDSIDSDADPSNGRVDGIELARDQVVASIDVGLVFGGQYPLGDVNCDGFTNIVDALLITLYEVQVRDGAETCADFDNDVIVAGNGDVNADGATNIIDALLIAQCEAALTNVLCPAP